MDDVIFSGSSSSKALLVEQLALLGLAICALVSGTPWLTYSFICAHRRRSESAAARPVPTHQQSAHGVVVAHLRCSLVVLTLVHCDAAHECRRAEDVVDACAEARGAKRPASLLRSSPAVGEG